MGKLLGRWRIAICAIRAGQDFPRGFSADMRRLAPVGGKGVRVLRRLGIAGVLAGALSAAFAQSSGQTLTSDGSMNILAPQGMITGGFSAPPSTMPARPPTGNYIKLMYPSAIAANGPDIYVADSGQRMLVRIDAVSRSAARLRELPPSPGTRVKTGPDGSVYVLSPGRREVERIARDGRRIAVFSAKFEVLQPADVVVEPNMNRVWISDAAGAVFAFHPSGRLSEPLTGRWDGFPDQNFGVTLMAAGRAEVAGIDPRCRCIIEFDRNGNVNGRFGEEQLSFPADVAIDLYDRVWILDRGDHRLKLFSDGNMLATITPAQLGLTDVTAIAFDAHLAYIADGPGGRIGTFAILQPTR